MADYLWPEALAPSAQSFFLQPHTGRSTSPFTRQQKVYARSAPLWISRMSFRGGANGSAGLEAKGAALDALIARLKGGQNRAGLIDWRRTAHRGATPTGNSAAAAGATTITLTGLGAGGQVLAGDYISGDGRPHIIVADATANGGGSATVTFEPPLIAGIASNAAVFKALGWFRLTSDEAGSNMTEVGQITPYDLEFVEDPMLAPPVFTPDYTLTIGGVTLQIAGEDLEIS